MKKLLSLVMVLMLALGCMATANATEITDYRTYITTAGEMETWNILYSQNSADLSYLTNCIDSLLTHDNHGNLLPNIAKSYSTPDEGHTWIFELNEGVMWSDANGEIKAETVAEDWLWGAEWILNFAKNDGNNIAMLLDMVEGAKEYYEYTKTLATEEGVEAALALDLTKFKEMVKIEATDTYTVQYTCIGQLPYFPTLATYNVLYPVSGALIAELGVETYKEVQPEQLWYNGPYTCTFFVHGNEKVFTANPNWWNKENNKTFNTVTVKCVESADVAFQYFQTGEIDAVSLSQSNLSSIYNNEGNEWHDYLVEGRRANFSFGIHLNFWKLKDDGTPDDNWNKAIANENFRQSLMFGLDPVPYLERTNFINPLKCQNLGYTGSGVVTNSQGVDYADLVLEELGYSYDYEKHPRFDMDKANEYKAKAIEELTAQGVTFPIHLEYWISGSNQTAMDTATVWKQSVSDTLGDDYVVMDIQTYISSSTQEVYNPQKQCFVLTGWAADYGDPLNYLNLMTYGEDRAYYSVNYTNINQAEGEELIASFKEYTRMINEAEVISETDARYDAFAKAEAYMIEHALVIPWHYSVSWQLTGVNDYSKIFSAYGIQTSRWINWETKLELYTTDEYAQIFADYNEGKF